MTRWRTRHRGPDAERGAAAVEFAIVLVVLLLLIFAIIDFGRLLYADQTVKAASREGARVAAVEAAWDNGVNPNVMTTVRNAAGAGVAMAGGTLSVTGERRDSAGTVLASLSDADAGSAVQLCQPSATNTSAAITVSTPFTWFTPAFLFAPGVATITGTTVMRCE